MPFLPADNFFSIHIFVASFLSEIRIMCLRLFYLPVRSGNFYTNPQQDNIWAGVVQF